MQDGVLFITIAEIAGVFVGFAALIAVTRRSEVDAAQLGQIQAVVTIGLLVVVAALVPVGLGVYDITGRGLWVAASVVYFALNWFVIILALRRPQNRQLAGAQARTTPVMAVFFWMLEVAVQLPLILVILGINPDLDGAFYMTALVFHLFEAAFILAQMTYTHVGRHQA